MENQHTIHALMRKRAELAGQLEHHQALVRQTMIDLDNVDATLRLFEPDIALDEIKPKPLPPRHAAYKGEVGRVILETLRTTKRPCTAHELAMHLMASRNMNTADKRLVKTVQKRVGAALRHYREKGTIRSESGAGGLLVWETA